MTQEDKQLLLKDICARLLYFENWVQYEGKDYIVTGYGHGRVSLLPSLFSSSVGPCPLIEEVKPYLRPMSSMTEEEKLKLDDMEFEIAHLKFTTYAHECMILDYLYSRHLDVRGLIPMGLALEAPAGMYRI